MCKPWEEEGGSGWSRQGPTWEELCQERELELELVQGLKWCEAWGKAKANKD